MSDVHPARWRMLALLSIAQLLGMSLWMAGTAIGPQLQTAWGLDASQVGWLTTAVQLGFVGGTAVSALLNLADIVPARRLFAISACLGAASCASLLFAHGFAGAIASRAATGFFLAGVYPPAMKMAATWFRARRGLAVGTVVGALTIGKASPYLINALPGAGVVGVTLTVATGAVIAALLVATLYEDGPYAFPPRPFTWSLVGEVTREQGWRLATGGYLGHMFELYSFWAWIPVFLAASAAARTAGGVLTEGDRAMASLLSFGVIAVGGAGCVWGGLVADRLGRERLVTYAMAASGACALLIGLTYGATWWIVAPIALGWGFFVIADSAQFSVLVTESVPPHAVGTALTVQTSLGFLLTTITIQLVPPLVQLVGWRWAFATLAIGPAAGIWSIRRLASWRRRSAASLAPPAKS